MNIDSLISQLKEIKIPKLTKEQQEYKDLIKSFNLDNNWNLDSVQSIEYLQGNLPEIPTKEQLLDFYMPNRYLIDCAKNQRSKKVFSIKTLEGIDASAKKNEKLISLLKGINLFDSVTIKDKIAYGEKELLSSINTFQSLKLSELCKRVQEICEDSKSLVTSVCLNIFNKAFEIYQIDFFTIVSLLRDKLLLEKSPLGNGNCFTVPPHWLEGFIDKNSLPNDGCLYANGAFRVYPVDSAIPFPINQKVFRLIDLLTKNELFDYYWIIVPTVNIESINKFKKLEGDNCFYIFKNGYTLYGQEDAEDFVDKVLVDNKYTLPVLIAERDKKLHMVGQLYLT